MPPSEAQKRAARKYKALKVKQVRIDFNLQEYQEFAEYCTRTGEKQATLIKRLIREHIDRDTL